MEVKSIEGSKYFLTFNDDFSRSVFVYFLASKHQEQQCFEDFKHYVENDTGKKIEMIRTDNGTEHKNRAFENVLGKSGIKHPTSAIYSPEQNGLAEKFNRTIVEKSS